MRTLQIILLCTFCAYVSAAVITFNLTFAGECSDAGPCMFLDPSLWEGGVAPSTNDSVIVDTTGIQLTDPLMLDLAGGSLALHNVNLTGYVSVLAKSNFSLEITNLNVQDYAVFAVTGAEVVVSNTTLLLVGSKLEIGAGGGFAQAGEFFLLDAGSSIDVSSNGGYLGLHAVADIRGHLSLPSGAMFASTQGIIFNNGTYMIQTAPIIYYLAARNAQVTFESGIKSNLTATLHDTSNVTVVGTLSNLTLTSHVNSAFTLSGIRECNIINNDINGTLVISSSRVRFENYQVRTPLIFAGGDSEVFADNLIVENITFIVNASGVNPHVTLISNLLHIYGPIQVFGSLIVLQYGFAKGSIAVNGDVMVYGSLDVDGALSTSGTVEVVHNPFTPPHVDSGHLEVFENSTLDTQHLQVDPNVSVTVREAKIIGRVSLLPFSRLDVDDGVFVGSVHNWGWIRIRERRQMVIAAANYTQYDNGTLDVHVDLLNKTAGLVNVTSGSAYLNGTVMYSLVHNRTSKSERVSVLVVTATGGVQGKFISKERYGDIIENGELLYESHNLYLVFTEEAKAKGKHPLPWWVWLLVSIGAIVVVGLLFLLYRTRHSRAGFKEVPIRD